MHLSGGRGVGKGLEVAAPEGKGIALKMACKDWSASGSDDMLGISSLDGLMEPGMFGLDAHREFAQHSADLQCACCWQKLLPTTSIIF